MKIKLHSLLTVLALLAGSHIVAAQGTAFTYQGRLNNASGPANGTYDVTYKLWNALSGGAQVGSTVTVSGTVISNGLFTATIDFGAVFNGSSYWLELGVRTNGAAAFTTLTPREAVTPTPYAITAESVDGPVAAGQLSGTIPSSALAGTYGNGLNLNNAGNNFIGNGAGLTGVNAALLGGLGANKFWQLGGNAGTTPGLNFLGTPDNQALQFKVNNTIALQFSPGVTVPNIVGGLAAIQPSIIASGVSGAVIAGGNAPSGIVTGFGVGDFQSVYDDDGSIGGGFGNHVGTDNGDVTDAAFATVAGGVFNSASGYAATVGGGDANQSGGSRSVVAGGYGNIIQPGSDYSSIGGGYFNNIQSNSAYSTIGGGSLNQIQTNASNSVIGGGYYNIVQSNSAYSTIGGGFYNQATNILATVLGGYYSVAGGYLSFAAGYGARALHSSAFVYSDQSGGYFDSTTNNEFSIRAQNGVRIQSDVGIHLNYGDLPLIVRDWDVFATNAPAYKAGIGRWGLFMEPSTLTIGIPSDDLPYRYFQVAKYSTNGTPTTLMLVDQAGNVSANSFNASGGTFSGNGSGLTGVALLGGANTFNGNLSFADPNNSIIFPATSGANNPMIYMFASGTANADRMVIAHSTAYSDWGLQYSDVGDKFSFLGAGFPAMTVVLGTGSVGIGTTTPSAKLHVAGTAGTDGIKFPDNTVQLTAPKPVFNSGYGLDPWNTNRFLGATVIVTVISSSQQILVTANKALGSTSAAGAAGLNLYIGYRPSGSIAAPFTVGGGSLGQRVAVNTRVTMGLSGVITGLAPGNYEVGLVGSSADYVNWNSNEYGYTTAVVY